MAIADWSETGLSYDVLVSAYKEPWADNIRQSQMQSGRRKRQKKYTKSPNTPLTVKLPPLTRQQVDNVETFFYDTLSEGVLPFTFLHPRKQVPITCYFVAGKPPEPMPLNGARWTIVLQLEIEP